jgi:HEAT repeat protein
VLATNSTQHPALPNQELPMPRILLRSLVVAAALVPAAAADQDEPSVQGKTLSEWRKALKDAQPSTRAVAARALGTLGPKAAPAASDLVPLLSDRDLNVRNQTTIALRAIGVEAVPALAEAIKGKDAMLRIPALTCLYHMQVPTNAAVPALKPLLKDTSTLRAFAAPLLAKGGEEGVKALIEASKDKDVDRATVLNALLQAQPSAEILEVAKTALKDPAVLIRLSALQLASRQGESSVPVLVEALKDGDAGVRAQAAFNLSTFPKSAKESVPALRPLLKDSSYNVRVAAVNALSRFGTHAKEALPEVAGLLEEKDPSLRQTAMNTLASFGKDALPTLEKLMKSQEPTSRVAVLSCLPRLGEDGLPLLRAGLKDNNGEVRAAAADYLSAMGEKGKDAVQDLTAALKDDEVIVRQAAAGALWRIEGKPGPALAVLLAGLEDEDQTVRDRAGRTLGNLGASKVVPAALKMLEEKDRVTRRRAALALESLGAQLKDSVPALVKALAEEDPVTRHRLATALARLNPPPEAALKEALSSQDEWQRAGAAQVLAGTVTYLQPPTVEAAAAALKDKNAVVRLHAAHVVARNSFRNRDNAVAAVKELTAGLKADEVSLRRQAAASLTQVRPYLIYLRVPGEVSKQIEEAMESALMDRDLSVRLQAARGLMGGQPVGIAVVPSRTDLAPVFAEGLKKGNRDEVLQSVQALAGLGKHAEPAVEALTAALGHKDSFVRQYAAYTLGTIGAGAKPAAGALAEMMTERTPLLRELAAQALGAIGAEGKEVVPALVKALKDSDSQVVQSALDSLSRFGPEAKPAVAALRKLLKDPPAQIFMPGRPPFPTIGGIGQPRVIGRDITSLVLDALAHIGPAAQEAIPDIAALFKGNDLQKRSAGVILGGMGPAAAPVLLEGLKSEDGVTRAACLQALGVLDTPPEDAIKAVARLLSEKDQTARRQVVFALGQFGEAGKPALSALVGVLKNKDNDAETRALAARAIGGLGPAARDAVEPLRNALKDDDEYVRLGAVVALGEIGPDARDAVPALSDLAREENPHLRRAVARTLDRIQGKQ